MKGYVLVYADKYVEGVYEYHIGDQVLKNEYSEGIWYMISSWVSLCKAARLLSTCSHRHFCDIDRRRTMARSVARRFRSISLKKYRGWKKYRRIRFFNSMLDRLERSCGSCNRALRSFHRMSYIFQSPAMSVDWKRSRVWAQLEECNLS